jgi:hypothetical protein
VKQEGAFGDAPLEVLPEGPPGALVRKDGQASIIEE